MKDLAILTQSAVGSFWDCQELYRLTYEVGLAPISDRPRALWLGSMVHGGLETWHLGRGLEATLERVAIEFSKLGGDRDDLAMARALLRGYAERHPTETWKVVGSEIQFSADLRNPVTGRPSKRFRFAGKGDLLVELTQDMAIARAGQLVLVEHKTSGPIDGGYVEKIWTDLQIAVYSHFLGGDGPEAISAVLYNVLAKPQLRRLEVNSRRSEPESDEALEERLLAKIREEPFKYGLRQEIVLGPGRILEVRAQLWRTARMILEARRSGIWIKNTRHCHGRHGRCRFYPLCSAPVEARQIVQENQFTAKAPHEELGTEAAKGEEIF